MADVLFDPPPPPHPDAAVAKEEVTRYYTDRLNEAEETLAAATAARANRLLDLNVWLARDEITSEGMAGDLHMAALSIVGHAQSRFMAAARASIDSRSDAALRAAVDDVQARMEALRRWLTAEGYGLGVDALPAPEESKRGRGKR